MQDDRQDPDKILKRVQAEESKKRSGKLKIYLGAAPGVGKTYTMLQDAQEKRKQGLDVVVGVIESHGRKDIEGLIQGLEILPLLRIEYKGRFLQEFDLDNALKRAPGLILIDEMAHSNIPGLRHAKRWQDIKELLDRGIDVYTTLNVQHIESLNNDVSGIIHAPIKETVPDSMLDLADTIELVDLPPEDLLKRLQDGKVYFPSQAELARDKYFRKGNLIALRQLALRVTADRVGAQVLLYRQGQGIKHIWSSSEKILVCVGPGDESLQLIRAARRLATSLQVPWIAVYVDSPLVKESDANRNQAIKNLRIAEQLGAETSILTGVDLVKEIMSFAREQNISLIMIWKHIRSRWQELVHRQLADEVMRNSQEINVYIITGTLTEEEKHKRSLNLRSLSLLYVYLIATGSIVLTTLFGLLVFKFINVQENAHIISLLYLLVVIVIALLGRVGPTMLAGLLSVLAYATIFYPLLIKISFVDVGYLLVFVLMIILVQIISNLTFINKRQSESARLAARKAVALYRLSHQLAGARGVNALLEIGAKYIADFFDSEVMVLIQSDLQLKIVVRVDTDKNLDTKELGVAQWVYDLGQPAGLGTDTLPESEAIYLPLLTAKRTMGVLRIKPKHPENLFTPDQMHFLETCANQLALTMEVDQLQEQRKQTELDQQIDHTRNVLLQSISQDLRAPLASIMLNASTQMQTANSLNTNQVYELAHTMYSETEQLSRLINNILQITYLESSSVKLHKHPNSLKGLIAKVIQQSRDKLGNTPVYIHIPNGIPLIPFDQVLMEGVFFNLLDNAIKFSPADQAIEIVADNTENAVLVSVSDRGPGIYGDEVSRLFEKFYQGRMLATKRGLGLGLAICRMIIEAHGGKIWAENRDGGGAIFKFTLPLLPG
jgi:two-component system sensor histidine kinase KdpD